jgi:hypothetical protein
MCGQLRSVKEGVSHLTLSIIKTAERERIDD